MATGANREVTLGVQIKTTGEDVLLKLAADADKAAKAGGDAAPVFNQLGNELRELAQQAGAVQSLAEAARETQRLADESLEAAVATEKLKGELAPLAAEAKRLADAQKQAQTELARLTQESTAARRALELYKAENQGAARTTEAYKQTVQQLSVSLVQSKTAVDGQKVALADAKTAAKEAADAQDRVAASLTRSANAGQESFKALSQATRQQETASEAARRLGIDVADLAAAEQKLLAAQQAAVSGAAAKRVALSREQAESDRLAAIQARAMAEALQRGQVALEQENAALADAVASTRRYEQAGRDAATTLERVAAATDKQVAAEAKLQQQMQQADLEFGRRVKWLRDIAVAQQGAEAAAKQAAAAETEFARTTNRLREEALQAAEALRQAFGTTGVRSLAAIDAEAKSVAASMGRLQREFEKGAISGQDLARALSSANVRLAQLNTEMQTIPALPGAFEKASASVSSLIGRFAGLGAAIATVGVAARPVIDTVLKLDQLTRTLTTVLGSSDAAAAAIERLRGSAQRSGQNFDTAAEQYAKFAASARTTGISLETIDAAFDAVAMAAGNLGLSTDQTGRALNALGQISAKGVVQMEELRGQLGDALPGALSLLAKGLGLSDQQLISLVESGQLLARDALPALATALTELGPKGGESVKGLRAEWERLKNTVSEATAALAEGAFGQATGAALGLVAAAVQRVVFGVTMLGEAFTVVGRQIGLVVAAVVSQDFKNLEQALEDVSRASNEKLGALANRIGGIGDAASGATPHVAATGAALQGLAQAGGESGKSFVQLQAHFAELLPLMDKQAVTAQKAADAIKIEGEARVKAAQLTGNETKVREAALVAALRFAEAQGKAAEAEAALAEQQRRAYEQAKVIAEQNKRDDAATVKRIEDLRLQAEAKGADAEKTKQQAEAARVAAVAMQEAALAAQDNSARVKEFREALELANLRLDRARELLNRGRISTEEYGRAEEDAARFAGRLKDALQDQNGALERGIALKRAEAEVRIAGLQAKLEELRAAEAIARANGDEAAAVRALIAQKELQAQIVRLTRDATVEEANAKIELLQKQYEEITGTDEHSAALRENIQLRILAERKTLAGAQASAASAKALEAEAASQRKLNTERRNSVGGTNGPAGGTNGLAGGGGGGGGGQYVPPISGIGAGGASGVRFDENGRTAEEVARLRQQGGPVDASFNFAVRDRLERGGSFSQSELAALVNGYRVAVQNAALGNPGSVTLEGRRDDQAWIEVFRRAIERASGSSISSVTQAESLLGGGNLLGSRTNNAAGINTSHTVTINLNGRATTVNTTSRADADALAALLQQLGDASNRSGGP